MGFEPENPHKWFNAREVSELVRAAGIKGFPSSQKGIGEWIRRHKREGFGREVDSFSRRRAGQNTGGGMEYYWVLFPERLWAALDAEVIRREAAAGWHERDLPGVPLTRGQRTHDWPTKPRLDLAAPRPIWAGQLALIAGLEKVPAFGDFVIRRVARARVKLDREFYFSMDLEPWHGKDVCVTRAEDAPHLAWVCEFDRPRRSENWTHGSGKFICLADNRAGKARYVSEEVQHQAEMRRAETYARRRALDTPKIGRKGNADG